MCRSAAERLTIAEQRIEDGERERRELITAAECKLQDASRALKQAQSRIVAVEDQLTAVEFRAQAAEAEAREARQALALVEEAIRRRLLCANPEGGRQHERGRLNASETFRPHRARCVRRVAMLGAAGLTGTVAAYQSRH